MRGAGWAWRTRSARTRSRTVGSTRSRPTWFRGCRATHGPTTPRPPCWPTWVSCGSGSSRTTRSRPWSWRGSGSRWWTGSRCPRCQPPKTSGTYGPNATGWDTSSTSPTSGPDGPHRSPGRALLPGTGGNEGCGARYSRAAPPLEGGSDAMTSSAGDLRGKVALVTGAARGQGRAHATTLARHGADVIAVDIATQIDTVPYSLGTDEDLAETAKAVEELDRRVLTVRADVRSQAQLDDTVRHGLAEFGRIDILLANAGIFGLTPFWEITDAEWDNMIATNRSGVWRSAKAVAPHMMERGKIGRA